MTKAEREQAIIQALRDGCQTTTQVALKLSMNQDVTLHMLRDLEARRDITSKASEFGNDRVKYFARQPRIKRPEKPSPKPDELHAAFFR